MYKKLNIFLLIFSVFLTELDAREHQIPAMAGNGLPAEKISEINRLSVTQRVPEALAMTEALLEKYPEERKLHLLYAKLLFWSNRPSDAKNAIEAYRTDDEVLYRKIYTAWAIKMLQEKKKASEKLEFIQQLENFARESYDVLWTEIQSLIEEKDLEQALKLSEKLAVRYPESREAQERFAVLLFWNGKYGKSLAAYQDLSRKYGADYHEQIAQLETILRAGSEETKKEITKQRRKKRKSVYRKKADRQAAVPPKRKKEPVEPAEMDKKHLAEYMTGIGFQKADYSDDRYRDRTKYIEMTLPVGDYTLYLKVQDTDRYNMNDKKIQGEFYPKLPDPQWGYLSFSYTPDTDFFSHYSIG